MKSGTAASEYVLGHSDDELVRLERQAAIFAEATEDILRRAGVGLGMRVLDLGCGVGDVSLIAANIVGPTGSVVGVDRSEEALATARRRAAAGFPWLTFQNADVAEIGVDAPFDAAIGRFILMHLPDPAVVLAGLKRRLVPDGIVAFIEMDISSSAAVPEMALFSQCLGWITTLYRRAGMEPDMGSKLYGAFRAAGMTPQLAGTCRIEAGPDSTAYGYIAETIRTMSPMLQKMGLATEAEIGIETLADRLRTAALDGETCFIFPRFIGAWARA